MDNLTHSLIGLTVAETALRRTPERRWSKGFPTALRVSSLVANNLPDIDFTYASWIGGKLSYLLHHRGHTHTLVGAAPLALLTVAFTAWLVRRKGWNWSRSEWKTFTLITVLGVVLHMVADSWNNYGVHPFWPFSNRWFFGDSVFIAEPTLWMAMLPPLFWCAQTWIGRTLYPLILAVTSGAVLFSGLVPRKLSLAIVGVTALWLVVSRKLSPSVRMKTAVVAVGLIVASFATVSTHSKTAIAERIQKDSFETRVWDLTMSPFPGNPFCWNFVTVETLPNTYLARRGIFAPFPKVRSAAACGLHGVATDDPHLAWRDEFRRPLAELRQIADRGCGERALFRFLRVPYWRDEFVGDLRFNRDGRRGFAEVDRRELENCDSRGEKLGWPHWAMPRADLLDHSSGS